ncbi:MAG: TIGR01212 family radical SAM protein, partial [Pseudomonadota bacterium]
MALSDVVATFGQDLLRRYGQRVHKIAINASFTCPNRDGSIGYGGCTFCNNASFSPNAHQPPGIGEQVAAGRQVVAKRTGARHVIAYFQAYTNTYGNPDTLAGIYEQAFADPAVVGLAVGTRPDCVAPEVLELLASYQARGFEVWLELGLQSANDETLARVNRGHGFTEYAATVTEAHDAGIPVCAHLMVGLPGEGRAEALDTLERVLALGVEGLKLHPLHIVKGTRLAKEWREHRYTPLSLNCYARIAADMIERTPEQVVFHRLTGTASNDILLAPHWCAGKWS